MKKIDNEAFSRLVKKKERRRLKRLKILNKRSKPMNTEKKSKNNRVSIVIPASLNIDDNRDDFIVLIDKIQDVLLSGKSFVIDHSKMEEITKEALLLLTAEIERCTTIMGIKLKAKSKYLPKNNHIKSLLKKIGYWDYFNLNAGASSIREKNGSELFLKIVGDTQVSGEKIGSLIEFFEKLICFDAPTKEKFSDAMIEAAANTVEHAYSKDQKSKNIKKWWLTASINTLTNEIAFIFYDQGLGILNTLEETQKSIKLRRLIAGWISEGMSKGGILKKLVTTNLSSYKDERRGNGLISFKTFINEVQGGELVIHSDDVSYSAVSDKIENYKSSIKGTLIIWKIEANQLDNKCIYIKGHQTNE